MVSIVQVNVAQQQAPTPITLQATGAIISQGATVLAPGSSQLVTQLSDLTGLIRGAVNLSALSWSAGTATATSAAPHGFPIGDTIYITIGGAIPATYNGTFLCTITSTTQFTYAMPITLSTASTPGFYSVADVAELNAQVLTYFAQPGVVAVYVLELGAGSVNEGVAALSAYIAQNPNSAYTSGAVGFYYSYLVPREWDGNANFIALIHTFRGTTARTYFWITTTLTNYPLYTDLDKEVIVLIEAPPTSAYASNALTGISRANDQVTATTTTPHGASPGNWVQIQGCVPAGYNGYFQAQLGTTGSTIIYNLAVNPGVESVLGTLVGSQVSFAGIPATEFSLAAPFAAALRYNPSSTNKVTPFSYTELFGVTPFPLRGNSALLTTLATSFTNVIDTGAEGGITTAILKFGYTGDGRDFTYWYSVDFMSLQSDVNIANEIINGSNNPLNPLYYSQDGINRLQDRVVATAQTAIQVGLALSNGIVRTTLSAPAFNAALNAGNFTGQIVVNAVPLVSYLSVNPGDYKIGQYNGLSVAYIPNRGFLHIVFNILVSDFVVSVI